MVQLGHCIEKACYLVIGPCTLNPFCGQTTPISAHYLGETNAAAVVLFFLFWIKNIKMNLFSNFGEIVNVKTI